MIEIKTQSGFTCEVSEHTLQDWRVIKALARAHKSKDDAEAIDAMSEIIALLFRDKEEEFYINLLDDDGIVSAQSVIRDVREILEQIGEQQKN